MPQWFYEKNGKPTGPVSQLEIARLIISGRVKDDTLVWTPSFGDKWRRADHAGLPRLVTGRIGSAGKPEEIEASAAVATSFLEALEKKQATLSSVWALILFFFFLLAELIPNFAGGYFSVNANTDLAALQQRMLLLFIIVTVVRILLLQQDRKAMAYAGYRPLSYWWIFFLPGYFLLRWERTKRYFGLFLFSLFIYFLGIFQAGYLASKQIYDLQKNIPVAASSKSPAPSVSQAPSDAKKPELKK